MASERGRDAAVRMQHQLHARWPPSAPSPEEGIDCHFDQGGYLSVARNPAQLERVRAEVADFHAWGFGPDDHRSAHEVAEFAQVSDALGGSWTPHCAAIHPARLVRGLAAVERRGVTIYERTSAVDVGSRRVVTRTAPCGPSTSCSPPRATRRRSRAAGGRSPRSTRS
ncbi:NAD(P)/FAD-dependent oxidoreductase [Humibacillus xanthopallidus]|uniref:NAD(P)/FAD-dependent oxidoreductase n=1 Tax=Humibacillus xanthopallidus TaxID=412689 RepID=UPI0021AB77C2|nr:FAD-dependent oxidoreductase [Humibacillus xanthopallidus]